jgi:carbamate kinase
LISTAAVEKVALNHSKPERVLMDTLTLATVKGYPADGPYAKGSRGTNVQASTWFPERGGKEAPMTDPASTERALQGETGTTIVNLGNVHSRKASGR